MSLVSIFSLLITLGVIFSILWKKGDVFSPGRIFVFLWSLAIGLTDLKYSRLQDDWEFLRWVYLLLGVFSFMVGLFIVYTRNISEPLFSVHEIRKKLKHDGVNDVLLFRIIVIIFVVFVTSYFSTALIKGFIPFFTAHPSYMRTKFGVFGLGILNHAAPSIMFFIVQYLMLVKTGRAKKIVLLFIFIITSGLYFLLLQRFDFAIWSVISVVFIYYCSEYLKVRTLILIISAFIGIFYWISTIRLTGHIANFTYIMSEMKFAKEFAIFTEPYMYLVSNLENFTRAAVKLDHHTYGYYTFDFLAALGGVKHWIAEYLALNDTPYLTSGYNTYSFLWPFYRDFGIIGLVFIPLLEGMAIAIIYYRLRRQPSIKLLSLYGFAVFTMIISFFLHAPSMLHFMFNASLVYFVNKITLSSMERKVFTW